MAGAVAAMNANVWPRFSENAHVIRFHMFAVEVFKSCLPGVDSAHLRVRVRRWCLETCLEGARLEFRLCVQR